MQLLEFGFGCLYLLALFFLTIFTARNATGSEEVRAVIIAHQRDLLTNVVVWIRY